MARRKSRRRNHPEIRVFTIQQQVSYSHADLPQGAWKIVSPTDRGRRRRDSGRGLLLRAQGPGGRACSNRPGGGLRGRYDGGGLDQRRGSASALGLRRRPGRTPAPASRGRTGIRNYVMHWYDQYDVGVRARRGPIRDWTIRAGDGGATGRLCRTGSARYARRCWFRKEIVLPIRCPPGARCCFLARSREWTRRTSTDNGRRQRLGGEPASLFCPRGPAQAGPKRAGGAGLQGEAGGRVPAKPEVLRMTLGETAVPLAGKWKGRVSVDARPPHPCP